MVVCKLRQKKTFCSVTIQAGENNAISEDIYKSGIPTNPAYSLLQCHFIKMSRNWVFVLLACFLTKIDGSTVFEVLAKVVNVCYLKNNTNVVACVKERCLVALDNVYRSDQEISLVPDWISLVRTEELPIQERAGKILLADMEKQSPQNKSIIVDTLIVRRIIDFLESRAISVKIPIVALDVFNILEEDEREGNG